MLSQIRCVNMNDPAHQPLLNDASNGQPSSINVNGTTGNAPAPPTTNGYETHSTSILQASPVSSADTPHKEKRHRNKPSLSCETCTVKKTKCDRNRPECFACQKRRTACRYSHLADMIEESHRARGLESPRKRQKVKKTGDEQQSHHAQAPNHAGGPSSITALSTLPPSNHEVYRPTDRTPSRSSTGSSPTLLSNVPFSHPTVSNIFKVEV